jgi:hypothetical protein
MEIIQGVIKKVLTEEQFEKISKGELNPKDIQIEETIRIAQKKDGTTFEYLPIRISYQEVNQKGKELFSFNEETQEYQKSYSVSPIIKAYGKEMRTILELGEFSPIKIVIEKDDYNYKLMCVQDLTTGLADI